MRTFRLIESYEFFVKWDIEQKLVRVEMFEAVEEPLVFRTRVWLQNLYNLYPTTLNLGPNNEHVSRLFSSDHLNAEITLSIADNPEWLTGISASSERVFFEMVQSSVIAFIEKANQAT
jgi:hypothetical protein